MWSGESIRLPNVCHALKRVSVDRLSIVHVCSIDFVSPFSAFNQMAYSSSIPNRMDRKLADSFRLFEQIFVENDSADEDEDNKVRLEENAATKDTKMKIFHPEAFAPLNKEVGSALEKSMKDSSSKTDKNERRSSRPSTSKSVGQRPETAMSSMSGTSAYTAEGRKKALTVHAAEEVRVLVWTTEHVMILYIISLFSSCDESSGSSTYIRGSCLHVILFELIHQQIVDMDYSPVRFKLSDGFQQHPVVWNISQEAEEMLRDLFFNKFITVLRAMSQDLTVSIFFQITDAGKTLLKHVPEGLLSDCHRVLYETLPDGSLAEILHVGVAYILYSHSKFFLTSFVLGKIASRTADDSFFRCVEADSNCFGS